MDAQPSDATREAAGPLSPRGVRMLKIAVVVMGIAILVGLAVVFVQIIRLGARPTAPAQQATVRGQPQPPMGLNGGPSGGPTGGPVGGPAAHRTGPIDVRVPLPAGTSMRSYQITGDRLTIHYEAPEADGRPADRGLLVLDVATGEVLARFRLGAATAK